MMKNNTRGLLAILMAMRMHQCDATRIARWSTTKASLGAAGRCHWEVNAPYRPGGRHGHRWRWHTKHKQKVTFS
jgi:hypothetical protein